LVQAAKIYYSFNLAFDIWWLALFALVPQVFISIKERKERKAKGWDDDIMSYVWTCFGIAIFVVNFINNVLSRELGPAVEAYRASGHSIQGTWSFASSYLLLVFGFPTLITGAARKQRWMLAGGIFCWVSAIVASFTPTYIDFVLMAFAAALSWLIPGLMIRSNYLKQKSGNV
jgi:magnesium-transporting ATPase (P-type)